MDQYLIVEPSNGDVDLGDAPRMYQVGEIVPTVMPELKGVMPMLFAVEHGLEQMPIITDIALRDQQEGLAPRICALVHTETSAEELLTHLGDVIALPRETEGYSAFRFYDPRVFRSLSWILRPEQLAWVYGSIRRWDYFSGQEWVSLTPPTAASTETLNLFTGQRATLKRLHLIELALKAIRDAGEQIDVRSPQRIDALFARGEHYGLSGEDLVVFAVQGLLVSPKLDRHPKVAAALQSGPTSSYSEITAQWTDEDWAQIVQEVALQA